MFQWLAMTTKLPDDYITFEESIIETSNHLGKLGHFHQFFGCKNWIQRGVFFGCWFFPLKLMLGWWWFSQTSKRLRQQLLFLEKLSIFRWGIEIYNYITVVLSLISLITNSISFQMFIYQTTKKRCDFFSPNRRACRTPPKQTLPSSPKWSSSSSLKGVRLAK